MRRLAGGQSTDDPCSTNRCVNDGNDVAKLGLKSRVEICAASDCTKAVCICEFGEDSDIAVVFELQTCIWLISPVKIECGGGHSRVAIVYAL